jgi:hypothetical protein
MEDEELKLIGLCRIQPRKITNGKGRTMKPSSYQVTIPRDSWDELGVRERKEKLQVFINKKKRQLVYQF